MNRTAVFAGMFGAFASRVRARPAKCRTRSHEHEDGGAHASCCGTLVSRKLTMALR